MNTVSVRKAIKELNQVLEDLNEFDLDAVKLFKKGEEATLMCIRNQILNYPDPRCGLLDFIKRWVVERERLAYNEAIRNVLKVFVRDTEPIVSELYTKITELRK